MFFHKFMAGFHFKNNATLCFFFTLLVHELKGSTLVIPILGGSGSSTPRPSGSLAVCKCGTGMGHDEPQWRDVSEVIKHNETYPLVLFLGHLEPITVPPWTVEDWNAPSSPEHPRC